MAQHADSKHRGCQFDSSICHIQDAICEERNSANMQCSSLETRDRAFSFCKETDFEKWFSVACLTNGVEHSRFRA